LSKPYVGAHILYNNEKIKVWRVKEEQVFMNNIEPGKLLDIRNNCMLIKCSENAVWIMDHEFYDLPVIGEYII
jgi:methionyl-tRNA formyltransferase